MRNADRRAFTLFELLAVLTVSGVLFMVILGSYNPWAAVHACNGAARVLQAGVRQARTLATARNQYSAFDFNSYTTNRVQHVSDFRIYLCTNDTGRTEHLLDAIGAAGALDAQHAAAHALGVTPAAPPQNLSGHIRLSSYTDDSSSEESGAVLFFRPDGSVWNGVETARYHYIAIYSRQLFDGFPLARLLRIDLATGAVELIREENTR
jgi:prepilin-type N-terminal cleavage/methylation domain-containing protein